MENKNNLKTSKIILALRAYHDAGLACLPTIGKLPLQPTNWKGGIRDENLYQDGIGILCGADSGGVECIDFDNHFGDATKNLSRFAKTPEVKEILGKYDSIPVESTMSGGFHVVYRCDNVEGNLKLAYRGKIDEKTGEQKRDILIETRGEGGYFACAPTEGYEVVHNDLAKIPKITPEEREIFLDVCRAMNEWYEPIALRNEPPADKRTDRPGDIYDRSAEAQAEMIQALETAGWAEVRSGYWRRPDKERGISATLGKVADNIFYCFSSSAYPFNGDSGYTPFQVVGLLKYGGDFSRFAGDLAKKYEKELPVSKTELTKQNVLDRLEMSRIDLDTPRPKPPVIMMVRNHYGQYDEDTRLFTLGNFSCITGKSKSKKTFLGSLFLSCAVGNWELDNKFIADMPENKKLVILFDTEQSDYDAYISARRIKDLLGVDSSPSNFIAFDLREYSPLERCSIVGLAFERYGKSIGYVMIDGVADLAKAINDEEEASRVTSLFMKWTKIHNCHITTVIHQNKNDNFATGHLGSAIMKKAECVIDVEKDPDDRMYSKVSCALIRGTRDFDDFSFHVDGEGMPRVEYLISGKKEKSPF